MNRYKLTNTETGDVVEREAETLDQAIRDVGWQRKDCRIEILPAIGKQTETQSATPAAEAPVKKKAGRKKREPLVPAESIAPAQQGENPPVPSEVVDKARATAEADQAEAGKADEAEKKMKKAVDKIDIHVPVGEATPAEKDAYEHKQVIEALAIEAEIMFLRMGQLLYNAREKAEWSILRYESYREYVEDLKLPMTNSYSWATRLSNIYEYLVKNMKLDQKLLAEIGVAKLTRLLPLARKGELTEEVIEAARILSDLDLREQLGHHVGGGDTEDMIVCPRCGVQFDAKKATRV